MALGSSVINKSSKKLAPKAPARRKPAGESTQSTQQSETQATADSQASVHDASTQPIESEVTAPRETVSKTAREQARQQREQRDDNADAYLDEIQAERPAKRRKVGREQQEEEVPVEAVAESQPPASVHVEDVPENDVPQTVATAEGTNAAPTTHPETVATSEGANAAPTAHLEATSAQRPPGRNVGGYLPTPEASQADPASQQASEVTSAAQATQPLSEPVSSGNQTQEVPVRTESENRLHDSADAPSAGQTHKDDGSRRPDSDISAGNQAGDVEMQDVADIPPGFEPAQSIMPTAHSDRPSTADAEALLALRGTPATSTTDSRFQYPSPPPSNAALVSSQAPESAPDGGDTESQARDAAPAKKPRQPRKKKATTTTASNASQDGPPGEPSSTTEPAKKPRKPRKSRAQVAALEELQREDENNDPVAKDAASVPPAKKPRKPRKPRASAAESSMQQSAVTVAPVASMTTEPNTASNAVGNDDSANNDGVPAETADGATTPVDKDETPETVKRKGGRKKREETPEENEDNEIDESETSMYSLTKDTRQGKISNREKEFRKINWVEVAARRREAEAEAKARAIAGEDENREEQAQRNREADDERRRADNAGNSRGPQLRLVNGQMVIDNESLVVSARRNENAELAIEESDLTKRINSNSFLYDNRRAPEERFASTHKSDPWTIDQTDAFYDALRMFGTDFFIISKMFPGKTRRHIKLKFVREERADPERVKAALIGEKKEEEEMNMTVYCAATGQEEEDFKDPEVLKEELRKQAEAQKEEIEKEREEAAEVARKKQEAAKEKTTRTKKSRKKTVVNDAGGDPEIDLGAA